MYTTYIVKENDTLESIANYFKTNTLDLTLLNGFTPGYIPILGEVIIVPNLMNQNFQYYTVIEGDNLYSIARRFNVEEDIIANLNGIDEGEYIYPNQTLLIPRENIEVYITKEGDTLNKVASNLGLSEIDLINQNNLIYLLPEQLIIKRKS